jgi:hypothetical protein
MPVESCPGNGELENRPDENNTGGDGGDGE